MIPKLMAYLWFFFLTKPVLGQSTRMSTCPQADKKKELLPCGVLRFWGSVHFPHVISAVARATGAELPPVTITPAWLRAARGPTRTPCPLGAQQDFSRSSSPRALTTDSWPHFFDRIYLLGVCSSGIWSNLRPQPALGCSGQCAEGQACIAWPQGRASPPRSLMRAPSTAQGRLVVLDKCGLYQNANKAVFRLESSR